MVNLLNEEYKNIIQKTSLTRKLVIDGTALVYPVYRVPLNLLYYNDQNDRISTWISQYKIENGKTSFDGIDKDNYNSIIEQFVFDSNPAALEKTKLNIELVGQREPGVILADGRVIDGNRRFTCLRQLNREKTGFDVFEAVILDKNIESGRKQIKLLELAIQHGEEKKVDYNPIDLIVGAYQDIVETELLSIEEYAEGTNEGIGEVKKRLEIGQLIVDFLDYIHMPKQYYVAREKQVVSIFTDLIPVIRKCGNEEEKKKLKETVFSNIMMNAVGDGRKYIRNISAMMDSGFFSVYMKEQEKIRTEIKQSIEDELFTNQAELDKFVNDRDDITEDMQLSLDKSLLKAKRKETRNKPSQMVTKSLNMLKDVDTRIIDKLTDEEKDHFKEQLVKLSSVVDRYDVLVSGDVEEKEETSTLIEPVLINNTEKRYYMGVSSLNDLSICCINAPTKIVTLSFPLWFTGLSADNVCKPGEYEIFFVDIYGEKVSNICKTVIEKDKEKKCNFVLNSRMSEKKEVYLIIKSTLDKEDECQKKICFEIEMLFGSDFDF